MAMRRPRFKAAVNLAPRRTTAAPDKAPLPSTDKPDVEPVPDKVATTSQSDSSHDKPDVAAETTPSAVVDLPAAAVEPEPTGSLTETPEDASKEPQIKTTRRIIKPSVCLPIRKRKPPPQTATEPVPETPSQADTTNPVPVSLIAVRVNAIDNQPPVDVADTPTPIISDPPQSPPQFKPPFMSPSMQHNGQQQKRSDAFVHNPFGYPSTPDEIRTDQPDETLAPLQSPNKVRQRIRPTPHFGLHRRNSMTQGGNDSESDAEPSKRQRLISSSSTHSAMAGNASVRGSAIPSRMRTESVCSAVSENFAVRDFSSNRPKKAARSEEFQRIVQAKRDFSARFQGNKPDKARLTMFDMIFYNPSTNPMKNPAVKSRRPSTSSNASAQSIKGRRSSTTSSVVSAVSKVSSIGSASIKSSIKIEKEEMEESLMPVPQLKLGPNGEIILDEKSLVIETTGDKEARETLANADIVYDDEFSGTSGFYKRSKRTRDWPPDETIRFYRCLHTIGTDFSLMLSLFPSRSRRDLKLKFKKEERNNPHLINKALLHPKLFDIDDLKKDFAEEEAEMERVRAEWEENKKLQTETKKNILKETSKKNRLSVAVREMSAGDGVYDLAESNGAKRKRTRKPKEVLPVPDAESLIIPDQPPVYSQPYKHEPASKENPGDHLSEWISTIPANEAHPDDSVISEHQIEISSDALPPEPTVDVHDIPMSSKDDNMFSDQFVDETTDDVLKLDDDDILNMEIIFDSIPEFPEQSVKDETQIPDVFFSDGQIASIHSIVDRKFIDPLALNNAMYLNTTKDNGASGSSSVQCPNVIEPTAMDVSNESSEVYIDNESQADIYYEEQSSQESVYSNTEKSFNESGVDLNVCSENAYNDVESANLTPAERVRDIDQHEHYYSDVSHLSPLSAQLSQETPQQTPVVDEYTKSGLPPINLSNEPKTEKVQSTDASRPAIDSKHETNVPVAETAVKGQQEATEDAEDDEDDDDDLSSLADSLVVVARKDADGNIVHEVFLMSPTTGCLSEEPLDLPAEVIERIKMSLMA